MESKLRTGDIDVTGKCEAEEERRPISVIRIEKNTQGQLFRIVQTMGHTKATEWTAPLTKLCSARRLGSRRALRWDGDG